MTEINLVFRFNISEEVYSPVEQFIVSDSELNIISGDKIRNVFLNGNTEIANKINYFINEGKIIPKEYWCSFWTSMINETVTNVFTSMIGDVAQFKEFEKCIKEKGYAINQIVYLKINNITQLTNLAKQKYVKIYENSEILTQNIIAYQLKKEEIIEYAISKYQVLVTDFFANEIIL